MTQEQSKYIGDVLQKLIDIPMVRKIKIDPKNCMYGYGNQTVDLDIDEVVTTFPDVKHPNWQKTVDAMKYIRDWGMDHIHGFEITFNNNYSKFKKQKI